MRIMRAQLQMYLTVEENLKSLGRAMIQARDADVSVLLTPELALTGFHRGIADAVQANAMQRATAQLAALSQKYGVQVCAGTPFRRTAAQRWQNAMIAVRPDGDVRLLQSKVGLTASEARFFEPGTISQVVLLNGRRTLVLFCREILDLQRLKSTAHDVQLVLWPSYIQWNQKTGTGFEYEQAAIDLATSLDCWVIQANWSCAINDPSIQGLGHSLTIAPDGQIIERAPFDAPDLAVFDLPIPMPTL